MAIKTKILFRWCLRLVYNTAAIRSLACAVTFLFAIIAPQTAGAHGETLIQIAAVTKHMQIETNNAQLYLNRAELYCEHQDWDSAKIDFDRAAQLDPKLPGLELCRAKMLGESGHLEAARALFTDLLGRAPNDGEAFIGRARVLVKLGNRQSAIGDYRSGLEALPSPPPEYFLELAQAFAAEKNTDDALRTLDQGIKRAGPIIPLQGYALELELERKNHAAALARIDTLIARASRKEDLLTQRGEILLASGRTNEAQESFEAALSAIERLPTVLQKAPPMQKLRTRIHAALDEITNAAQQSTKRELSSTRSARILADCRGSETIRAPLVALTPHDLLF